MELSFTKMQGCANDYIYLDCRTAGVPENIAALSEKLSRRHFSIGADGIICICAPRTAGADAMMRIFNADGSEGRMCGNGIRCVAGAQAVRQSASSRAAPAAASQNFRFILCSSSSTDFPQYSTAAQKVKGSVFAPLHPLVIRISSPGSRWPRTARGCTR